MRRFLILLLVLGVGVVLGRMFDGVWSTAEAGGGQGRGGAVSGNGDVNGDGSINIVDAVYLLNWIFDDGPEPEPCESDGRQHSGLPDTGQTLCYEPWGEDVIDCTSDTCAGQDGFYQTGCPSEGRFVDNGDGTVTDNCTDLMWQQDTADVNGDGIIMEEGDGRDVLQWCDALAYCESLELAGHDDWRLPNIRELQSIVDYGRLNPSIDPVFGSLSSYYWSSTPVADSPNVDGTAWFVGFDDGHVSVSTHPGLADFFRAVRNAP